MVPPLAPAPPPLGNPLVGLVPYEGVWRHAIEHSMEFSYVGIAEVAKEPGRLDWARVDGLLKKISGRGHQAVLRFYLEYPDKRVGLPAFLKVPVTEWKGDGTTNFTPDYDDPRLRAFVKRFIAALGRRYDGDPRLAYLTMGVLGRWGEWHDWPREELFAKLPVQREVMNTFQNAFRRTPVLMRYPLPETRQRPFGFHDDSFAWSTLTVPGSDNDWFFMTRLRREGLTNAWKARPIGGEIRPEAWGICFDPKPAKAEVQNFDRCVDETHASWLMDSGMFSDDKPLDPARLARARRSVGRMGYVHRVLRASLKGDRLETEWTNVGAAPFYADWRPRLGWLDAQGSLIWSGPSTGSAKGLLPGARRVWKDVIPVPPTAVTLVTTILNPMPGGAPVRYANAGQDRDRKGWLTLLTRR